MFTTQECEYIKEMLEEDQSDLGMSIKNKIVEMTKDTGLKLWKFHWDYGRSGDVRGLFKATQEEIDKAIGNEVYFGEILGKHSEVYGVLEECDLTLVSDNPVEVNVASESGYNPLEYIQYDCVICGDSYEPYEFSEGKVDSDGYRICNYCDVEED